MELTVLPARDGDCLVLSYGDPRRHVLVDGGRAQTYEVLKQHLARIAERRETLELLVVTHYDDDHIAGILALAEDDKLPIQPKHVWFNTLSRSSEAQAMSARQGDKLAEIITKRGWPINQGFPYNEISVSKEGQPRTLSLPGGLSLTVLSPDPARLAKLREEWSEWREQAESEAMDEALQTMGIRKRQLPEDLEVEALCAATEQVDAETANGSSIALLARINDRSVLLAADANPELLGESIQRLLAPGEKRLSVSLATVSHHGSKKNTSSALVRLLDCDRYVFSTDGSRHGHPNPETVARILMNAPERPRTLIFNHRQPWTQLWEKRELKQRHNYDCLFPAEGESGIVVSV